MSHPHLQEQTETELAYPLSRTRRRWLVALMGIATLSGLGTASMIHQEPVSADRFIFAPLFIAGALITFICLLALHWTMKGITAARSPDERQKMVTSRAYRTAFHFLAIGIALIYFLYTLSMVGWFTFDWVDLQLMGLWIIILPQALPMAVMAWTEPD
ncbi:MAG: hypothetical protein H0T53_09320 [Herpetosiphonaceae bacterium]|nr:hypothetical protein [Herpetosiphonaceae bacterium]